MDRLEDRLVDRLVDRLEDRLVDRLEDHGAIQTSLTSQHCFLSPWFYIHLTLINISNQIRCSNVCQVSSVKNRYCDAVDGTTGVMQVWSGGFKLGLTLHLYRAK